MDPREVLDQTIKVFRLKASDLAQASGITVQMLSRYRNKHQDMNSLNVFEVLRSLPPEAQKFFWETFHERQPQASNEAEVTAPSAEPSQSTDEGAPDMQTALAMIFVNELTQLQTEVNEVRNQLGLPVRTDQSQSSYSELSKLVQAIEASRKPTPTDAITNPVQQAANLRDDSLPANLKAIFSPQPQLKSSVEKLVESLRNPDVEESDETIEFEEE